MRGRRGPGAILVRSSFLRKTTFFEEKKINVPGSIQDHSTIKRDRNTIKGVRRTTQCLLSGTLAFSTATIPLPFLTFLVAFLVVVLLLLLLVHQVLVSAFRHRSHLVYLSAMGRLLGWPCNGIVTCLTMPPNQHVTMPAGRVSHLNTFEVTQAPRWFPSCPLCLELLVFVIGVSCIVLDGEDNLHHGFHCVLRTIVVFHELPLLHEGIESLTSTANHAKVFLKREGFFVRDPGRLIFVGPFLIVEVTVVLGNADHTVFIACLTFVGHDAVGSRVVSFVGARTLPCSARMAPCSPARLSCHGLAQRQVLDTKQHQRCRGDSAAGGQPAPYN